MGSWGITMRESDYGLDLLGTLVETQLKAAEFSSFLVTDALEAVKADIMDEIWRSNRGYSRRGGLGFLFQQELPV